MKLSLLILLPQLIQSQCWCVHEDDFSMCPAENTRPVFTTCKFSFGLFSACFAQVWSIFKYKLFCFLHQPAKLQVTVDCLWMSHTLESQHVLLSDSIKHTGLWQSYPADIYSLLSLQRWICLQPAPDWGPHNRCMVVSVSPVWQLWCPNVYTLLEWQECKVNARCRLLVL